MQTYQGLDPLRVDIKTKGMFSDLLISLLTREGLINPTCSVMVQSLFMTFNQSLLMDIISKQINDMRCVPLFLP